MASEGHKLQYSPPLFEGSAHNSPGGFRFHLPSPLLSRRNSSGRYVGVLMVVSPEPFSSSVFQLLDRLTQIVSAPLLPDGSIVALDLRVLLGLARLDMMYGHSALLSPRQERVADLFRSVVHPNGKRLTTPLDKALQRPRPRSASSEKSASMPSPSQLKSSNTFSNRKPGASSSRSAIKSREHVTFGSCGTASSSGFPRFYRLRGLILRLNSRSR